MDKRAHYLQLLINELKKAKTNNQKLDEAIALLAGYRRTTEDIVGPDGLMKKNTTWMDIDKHVAVSLPKFTHSIDMARRFVEIVSPNAIAGCAWERGSASAQVNDGPRIEAHTPAIALCLAGVYIKLNEHKNKVNAIGT